jgi:hypothetical protein
VSRRRRVVGLTLAAAVTVAGAGCGSAASRGHPDTSPRPAPAVPLPGLATSVVTSGGSWAVVVLGGSSASDNNFWQLFARPAGSPGWRLVTPPGVASNGGLVAASLGGRSLIAGFRPSQDLVFSPLASTGDDGSSWSAGVLDAKLGNVPDALAAESGGGRLLALLSGGQIDQAGRGAAAWSRLSALRSVAASPAGRRCAVTRLTAVAFSPSGPPLAGGTCTRAGVSGVFAYAGGRWQPAGPVPPATMAGRPLQVLRLSTTSAGEVALLGPTAGGSSSALVAAWSRDGVHWSVSAPLAGPAAAVRSAGFSAAGAAWVLLANGQADTVTSAGTGWQSLPRPPAHTSLLAFGSATSTISTTPHTSSPANTIGPSGSSRPAGIDALATFGSRLTVWTLTSSGAWRQAQAMTVPIQYGSSG